MKHDVFYEAMLARDYRFDGKFFIGVKTTGVYCRPICPARPKRENVEFFASANAAARAGYRPCLRCRPECAPLSPAWQGKSAVVQRALRAIAASGSIDENEDAFAERFGVTARHLRRLFLAEIGQTPKQIANLNRLDFSRKLIVETGLPMTSVGLTAGFSSLRRFNDAFKKRFRRAPSALRKMRAQKTPNEGIELSLSYRPPLAWETLLGFYRSHRIVGVETVTDTSYERVFRFGDKTGFVRASHQGERARIRLEVVNGDPTHLFAIARRIRLMFDLDSDPLLVANCFQSHEFLDWLWKKYPGLRVARGWDPFETAIGTILGQLVSMNQARQLVAGLVDSYGEKVIHPITGAECRLFPGAAVLATSDLGAVKTTQARREAIREFSKRVLSRELDLVNPLDPARARKLLLGVRGLGPWSAEYICLRALGDTDAFPGSDLILKRAMEKHADLDLERVRPWRSYAAVYLWRHYADLLSKQKGGINEVRL